MRRMRVSRGNVEQLGALHEVVLSQSRRNGFVQGVTKRNSESLGSKKQKEVKHGSHPRMCRQVFARSLQPTEPVDIFAPAHSPAVSHEGTTSPVVSNALLLLERRGSHRNLFGLFQPLPAKAGDKTREFQLADKKSPKEGKFHGAHTSARSIGNGTDGCE